MVKQVAKATDFEVEVPISTRVAILDAGAQYGKVIDRRIRGLFVRSDILPIETPYTELKHYGALIISGGPESVYAPDSPRPDPSIFKTHQPMLGICYGMQLINQAFGGSVEKKSTREDGQFEINVDNSSPFFKDLASPQHVLMSHGDSIDHLAKGFKKIASSGEITAAIADDKRRIYGVQFHPEVDLTKHGKDMLANFVFNISKLKRNFTLDDRLEEAIKYIRDNVRDKQVLSFASGGVDSTICSVLLGNSLPPKQITVVHIDTGFMRSNESRAVKVALSSVGIEMEIIDASEKFAGATTTIKGRTTLPLKKVTDPEIKRAIIGDTFVKVMEGVVKKLNLDPENTVLAQGTLRPDLIESASKAASTKAAVIKTHHNDSELVRKLREEGKVIEPLQSLHKDEVRELGESLGLPEDLVWRQPFPGPGLAIRLICADKPYVTDDFKEIEASLDKFANKNRKISLLPIRTVGVQGDGRSYSYVAAISGEKDWQKLMSLAREIPKKIHQINRVVYVFGDRLGGTNFNITPTYPTKDVFDQLRRADEIVNKVIRKYHLQKTLSQVPVILFPIDFGRKGSRSIAIRTFITNDFMTGTPAIPGIDFPENALNDMVEKVLTDKSISRVVYDLTAKPPGTTEWE